MNENNIPVTCEASVITSVSSSNSDDIIDLTEINDSDVCEVTSSCSVIVSNNSVCPQHPRGRPARNRRRTNTNSSEDNPSTKESADDSIYILYEKIQPPPEIVVVNEVIIDSNEQNQSAGNDSIPMPIPVVMGTVTEQPFTFSEDPCSAFSQIPDIFPEMSNERITSSFQPIDYSLDTQLRATPHSTPAVLHSCKYANITERPKRFPLDGMQGVLNLKNVPPNFPSHGSGLENSDILTKAPKIQCGICLDGPDEIAASDRNFTSTNCGHVFCNTCIKTSMRSAAKCPKCRKKITARSIHPLYL